MKYDLAKELKDVGFPQTFESGKFYSPEGLFMQSSARTPYIGQDISVPTLSELIDACGECFTELHYSSILKEWDAKAFLSAVINGKKYSHMVKETAANPEEAVAKLLLALRQK